MDNGEAFSPPNPEKISASRQKLLAAVPPILGIGLFLVAAWILRREFQTYHLDDILSHLRSMPPRGLASALALTVVGYGVLTGYDALAFRYIRNPLSYTRIALSSFVAYVFSHNIGLSFFGGSAVRYRMLSAWGIKAEDIARVIAFVLVTFWMGFVLLGGILHTIWPLPISLSSLPFTTSRPIGVVLLTGAIFYIGLTLVRRDPILVRGFVVEAPASTMTMAQFALSITDWLVAAGVLYVLIPGADGLTFPLVAGAYLLAQVVGIISHVPGGLGVFETAMVLLLKPWLPGDEVLASILAYRIIYYLLPMGIAVVLFGAYEISEKRVAIQRSGVWLQDWMSELVPRLFALTVFLGGAMLLLSGATPELPERLGWIRRTLPLPLIEVSKLLGSMIGVLLLLLANALRKRLDAGYVGTLALLIAGAMASIAKGLDWEEAALLTTMAVFLLPCRPFFYRKSSLFGQPLSRDWWVAVAIVVLGSLAALELGYKHVEYSNELWWNFAPAAEAPRSLRAMLAAGVLLVAIGGLRLLRPVPPIPDLPTEEELDRAQVLASKSDRAAAHLAVLGDKELLFHEDGNAFLMYGISGRTWVAMGDPVGPAQDRDELAWRFRELADQHGATAVFYEVTEESLPIYLELGLSLLKLGEEGRVPLANFSLDGSARKDLRQAGNRMEREGCSFELVPEAGIPSILDELEGISNRWLADKNAREKRFSLGFFERRYLLRFPVAVVRKGDRIVAFANVWPSDTKVELSIDLMRYTEDAPPGVMEYLFGQLMLWGRDAGYRYFSLGMAPLAGFEHHRLAPLWNRFGALLFRNGEHFYNFQGLRHFKEKFDPEWEPRYLASPGGLMTPLVLTRIATLVSGGATGIISR